MEKWYGSRAGIASSAVQFGTANVERISYDGIWPLGEANHRLKGN